VQRWGTPSSPTATGSWPWVPGQVLSF